MREYLEYPVDVSTTLEHRNAVDFPAVTVCNRNRVSCARLNLFLSSCSNQPACQNSAQLRALQQLGCGDQAPSQGQGLEQAGQASDGSGRSVDFGTLKKRKKKPKKGGSLGKVELKASLAGRQQGKQFIKEQNFLAAYQQVTLAAM